jgi:hypothetical protein
MLTSANIQYSSNANGNNDIVIDETTGFIKYKEILPAGNINSVNRNNGYNIPIQFGIPFFDFFI